MSIGQTALLPLHERAEGRKILVVGAKFSGQFPDPLNRVEIGTVWREVIELKASLNLLAPVPMQGGMVVFGEHKKVGASRILARNDPGLNILDFQGMGDGFPHSPVNSPISEKAFATASRRDTIEFHAGPRDFVRLPVQGRPAQHQPDDLAAIALAERPEHCRPSLHDPHSDRMRCRQTWPVPGRSKHESVG